MRDFHLRFCTNVGRWYDGMVDDLVNGDVSRISHAAGAYILGSSRDVMLTYPWGSSPVFYIGKANNLQRRALEHRKWITAAIHDHDEVYWWPRYQYGAAFGASFAWYSRRGEQDPQNLESQFIEEFYKVFGAIPAANSYWPNKIMPKKGTREDE